jgi:N-ethylmaleimide reductase
MTRGRAGEERLPNQLMQEYYTQRSSAGLIITEGAAISKQGIGWIDSPGIYSDEQADAWKNITDAVHSRGSSIFLQLWHCGRASHSSFQENRQLPVAPSAVKLEGDDIHTTNGKQPHETPRALETDEIPSIVEDYRAAAEKAKRAGFTGVEIHAANGYLVDEFLQSRTNHRTDRYGGSMENRFRFLDEIVRAIATVWPPNRIGVHLAPNGIFNDMGSTDFREMFLYAAKELDRLGLAYLHIVDGLAFGFHKNGSPLTLAEFREVFNGPLIGNCGYTKETAEEVIRNGHADMISFGRDFLSNPDLVERFKNGWELNSMADMAVWYSSGAEGYTDFTRHGE